VAPPAHSPDRADTLQEPVIRISLDATPLLGRRTGVGRYVQGLLGALLETPQDEISVTAFTLRGARGLAGAVPHRAAVRSRPVPARLLRFAWTRTEWPSVLHLAGRSDVFHGTNFVLPPTGLAGGVVTVHDLAYLRYPGTVDRASSAYRELVPRSIHRAGQVVVPSAAVAAELADAYGLPDDRLTITPLGVDEVWFTATPPTSQDRLRAGLPEDYLLSVGTIEPRKGLQRLLAAYRELLSTVPDAPPLVLVGPPGWGTQLNLAGLPQQSVLLTGYLRDDELRRVVAGARALVFPSLYEGFGLPPLEALASGVPVVATDLPVTREVLGNQARFVASADDLVAALTEAARGDLPGTSATRREHARRFTWARCAAETRQAYLRSVS
jgi:glycosyltransferase involved in cell wall biosynthesis